MTSVIEIRAVLKLIFYCNQQEKKERKMINGPAHQIHSSVKVQVTDLEGQSTKA